MLRAVRSLPLLPKLVLAHDYDDCGDGNDNGNGNSNSCGNDNGKVCHLSLVLRCDTPVQTLAGGSHTPRLQMRERAGSCGSGVVEVVVLAVVLVVSIDVGKVIKYLLVEPRGPVNIGYGAKLHYHPTQFRPLFLLL